MTDREQTRRDAEEVITHGAFVHEDLPVEVAQHCLALLAELEQAEKKARQEFESRMRFFRRAEQAERERDGAERKWLAAAADCREYHARLAKVPALVEAAKRLRQRLVVDGGFKGDDWDALDEALTVLEQE